MLKLGLPVFLGSHLCLWFDSSVCSLTKLKEIADWLHLASLVDIIYNLDVVKWFWSWLFSRAFVENLNLEVLAWHQYALECYGINWVLKWLGCSDLGKNGNEKAASGSSFSICWVCGCIKSLGLEVLTSLYMVWI